MADGPEDIDDILAALSSQRFRHVCYYLVADDITEIDIVYLARQVAAWETGADLSQIPADTINRFALDLHHRILPQLEEAGILSYDPQTGTIHYQEPSVVFQRLLHICESVDQP